MSLSITHPKKLQDQKDCYSWHGLRCNANAEGWKYFQDNPVLLQVGYFCGRYTQEIEHLGGENMLDIIWVK